MKKAVFSLFTFLLIFNACKNITIGGGIKGEGPMEKTERSVNDFKGVDLMASADVNVKQADAFKVTIEGQKNITDLLETVVENNILKIRFKNNVGNLHYDKLIVNVEAPTFNKLILSGSGNLVAENAISTTDALKIDITGSGDLTTQSTITSPSIQIGVSGSGDLNVKDAQTEKIEANIIGSGSVRVAGKATNSGYEVSGSGNIDGSGLQSQNVTAAIVGSGDIKCHADATLEANVSGSGDVYYSGTPSVKSRVTGSGGVSSKN